MTAEMTNIYNEFLARCEGNKPSSGIQRSFETFEKTGAHEHLCEIYNKLYVLVDKAYFSLNLMYIPGRFVIAYKDIAEVEQQTGFNEFRIKMVDGQEYHLCMLKKTYTELAKHVSPEIAAQITYKPGFWDRAFRYIFWFGLCLIGSIISMVLDRIFDLF